MPSAIEIETETSSQNSFDRLVDQLCKVLGPCSGINSDEVDPVDLQRLMEQYNSKEAEWEKYAFGDTSRPYTRNLVDEGNGKSNLLILVWTPGRGSPVHDHANAHCIMKVLRGSLQETLYEWPEKEGAPLTVKKETRYTSGAVTYMSDTLGLHKISNPDPLKPAVSLHLYTPPNAAKYGCHMFNEKTGASSHVEQCHFFSYLGHKI